MQGGCEQGVQRMCLCGPAREEGGLVTVSTGLGTSGVCVWGMFCVFMNVECAVSYVSG